MDFSLISPSSMIQVIKSSSLSTFAHLQLPPASNRFHLPLPQRRSLRSSTELGAASSATSTYSPLDRWLAKPLEPAQAQPRPVAQAPSGWPLSASPVRAREYRSGLANPDGVSSEPDEGGSSSQADCSERASQPNASQYLRFVVREVRFGRRDPVLQNPSHHFRF